MWQDQSSGVYQHKMNRILVLLCMAIVSIARCQKIHEDMTPEEMLSVFQTSSHHDVPAYEVVPVLHTPHKRSPEVTPEVHLRAFGENYNLSLKSTKGLLKPGKHVSMWTVSRNASSPDGLDYEEVPEGSADIGDIYQDPDNMASILLHRDANGKVLVEGNIGSELVIRPLPERVLNEIVPSIAALHEENSLPNVTRSKRDLSQTHHHVVFKRVERPLADEYSDFAFMEPDHLARRFRSKRSITPGRSKRDAPYVIYPEILCIVDYDGYRLHGGDNVQIKRYFVSFWNGVDMRYKLLKGPKIRISIAGIIISRGRDATPYLERNRVGRDAIDSAAALTDMGKYLFRERRLPVYDIAVAVTKLDMCRRQYANDVCNRGTAGFAYVGGACVVNKRLEKVNSVAIIEDTGGFSGIIVAAHEVGHLLGAVHDGSPPPSYLGGPGAEKCRWEDGYIMSDLRHTEKGFKWSYCSVSSFHHFLNGDTATCLYNAPHEDEALPRVLPGKLLSLDAQCRKDRGTSACFKDDRVCAQLFCFDAGSGYCVAYRPAAEGSPCGDGQYCLNGKCVAEHENIIPDYTQNIPTYVRRDSIYNSASQSRPTYAQYNSTDYRYPWGTSTQPTPQSTTQYKSSDHTSVSLDDTTYSRPPSSSTQRPKSFSMSTRTTPIPQRPTGYNKIKNYDKYYNRHDISTTKRGNYLNNLSNVYSTTSSPIIPSPHYSTFSRNTPYSFLSSVSQSTAGRETEGGECIDVASDCAEQIDRLRMWLCHLQSVKRRCCASLKNICG
ncbi:A disintegrin and metalloproteinase with thrombospondin motifs 16 isoform X1 [Diachasma alloeum]|uniref:A disintegrin and metalloproteinase with thrombospondin motifs 16 isoform X1 n=1 Tax=Diachasma alloeum TaxID=454923 RepID=UPI0007382B0C|nr:A disintegrin and metalloproteinase with thrombospondin motifs 16 isoform X1 [Diachasma alloeum]XP_015113595.1 A disintegrin and metalloproteinase with thrombospondin motifs 16 isoform X1 [Diachasma alloeum]